MSAVRTRALKERPIPEGDSAVVVKTRIEEAAEPGPTVSPGAVRTYYFRETFDAMPLEVAGRPVVTCYAPRQWRHSHEEEYEREWNETAE
jgi:hypothetical protein